MDRSAGATAIASKRACAGGCCALRPRRDVGRTGCACSSRLHQVEKNALAHPAVGDPQSTNRPGSRLCRPQSRKRPARIGPVSRHGRMCRPLAPHGHWRRARAERASRRAPRGARTCAGCLGCSILAAFCDREADHCDIAVPMQAGSGFETVMVNNRFTTMIRYRMFSKALVFGFSWLRTD